MNTDSLVRFFNEFSPESLDRLAAVYTEDAHFKDPFNEVRGLAAIRRIYAHMYEQLKEPRFLIRDRIQDEHGCLLVWDFSFRRSGSAQPGLIHGVSLLRLDPDGRIREHIDYWDAAEQVYSQVPVLGWALRSIRRRISASA